MPSLRSAIETFKRNVQFRNDITRRLYHRGMDAFAEYIASGEDRPLYYSPPEIPTFTTREVTYLIEQEKVCHLDDLVLRRSLLA